MQHMHSPIYNLPTTTTNNRCKRDFESILTDFIFHSFMCISKRCFWNFGFIFFFFIVLLLLLLLIQCCGRYLGRYISSFNIWYEVTLSLCINVCSVQTCMCEPHQMVMQYEKMKKKNYCIFDLPTLRCCAAMRQLRIS